MDRLFGFAVLNSDLPRDAGLQLAVRQSSVNPARALGLPSPELRAGGSADLVVLNSNLAVSGVLFGGQWVPETISGA